MSHFIHLITLFEAIPIVCRHVARIFSLGGGGGGLGERSELTHPTQLRSDRSEKAAAGVWGRGPGAEPLGGGRVGRSPPFFFEKFVGQQ